MLEAPIGVFDSGVGGLTVLAALRKALPDESFIYLGDTARLPYGTKSAATVERYAMHAADVLVARGVKALVIACNTASSVALGRLQAHFGARMPVLGVIEPGAAAACAATMNRRVLVMATEATVRDGAYERAILAIDPSIHVTSVACQVLVAVAEEGWSQGEVVDAALRSYLDPVCPAASPERPDTLVLGCTHFPLLRSAIQACVGEGVAIVDSATTAADRLTVLLRDRRAPHTPVSGLQLLATDGPARFARVGSRFLGQPLTETDVELVEL